MKLNFQIQLCQLVLSSSARRTWIEITNAATSGFAARSSSSARRTWIEITWNNHIKKGDTVVLRTEDVD